MLPCWKPAPKAANATPIARKAMERVLGVAAAAQILNMQATIVMPKDSPLTKRERTKAYGAEVVLYDRVREDRQAIAAGLAEERHAALVPPYDDPLIIAGRAYQEHAIRAIAERFPSGAIVTSSTPGTAASARRSINVSCFF